MCLKDTPLYKTAVLTHIKQLLIIDGTNSNQGVAVMLTQEKLKQMASGDIHIEAQVYETKRECKEYLVRRRNCLTQIARRAGARIEYFNHICENGHHKIGVVVCQKVGDAE